MPTPTVSIVFPTYNRAALLPRAIESCLQQTFQDLEVIVVDDGSQDGTEDIIRAYSIDPRVRYFKKENSGLPTALNYGFARSRGHYLTWTSDDNRYHPRAIEDMYRILEVRPDVGFVYATCNKITRNGQMLGQIGGSPEDLMNGNCVGACFLYRRLVYELIGHYDASLALAEDYDYWLRVSLNFEMLHVDRALYDIVRYGDSLTERHGDEIQDVTQRVQRQHIRHIWTHFSGRKQSLAISQQGAHARSYEGRWAEAFALAVYCLARAPLQAKNYRLLLGVWARWALPPTVINFLRERFLP